MKIRRLSTTFFFCSTDFRAREALIDAILLSEHPRSVRSGPCGLSEGPCRLPYLSAGLSVPKRVASSPTRTRVDAIALRRSRRSYRSQPPSTSFSLTRSTTHRRRSEMRRGLGQSPSLSFVPHFTFYFALHRQHSMPQAAHPAVGHGRHDHACR